MSHAGQIWIGATNGWAAPIIRWVTRSPVNHVKVGLNDNLDIGAEPGGARIRLQRDYQGGYWSRLDLTDEQRAQIVALATELENTPYNWYDDLLIPLVIWLDKRGIAYPKWLQRHISTVATLQCAQLADLVYETADIHIFNDGRVPGAVYPGSFVAIFKAHGWMP